MARKPKAIATANDDREKLLAALDFVALATKGNDDGKSSFVAFHDHYVFAENDTFSVGVAVDVGLELCPQADKFRAALIQCDATFQLTQLDPQSVSIKSGDFRALVPAIASDLIARIMPDNPCALIDDRLKAALEAGGKAMTAKGDRVFCKSVLLRSGSTVGTNGGFIIEYWHGIDLPGVFAIPKKTVEAIVAASKPLYSLGYSENSITFYFADGSFLKSRLMSEPWPDVDRLLGKFDGSVVPLWPTFYVALKAITAFIQNDLFVFHADHLGTSADLGQGASYKVTGIPPGYAFSAIYWKILEPFIANINLSANARAPMCFTGPNVRGMIMGKTA